MKLSQDTFQLPADIKERVNVIAKTFGYLRSGHPSRSAVYREMLRFTLDNYQQFLEWRARAAVDGIIKVPIRKSKAGGR